MDKREIIGFSVIDDRDHRLVDVSIVIVDQHTVRIKMLFLAPKFRLESHVARNEGVPVVVHAEAEVMDGNRPALYMSVSPFKFSQPDFWYEALSPFFTYASEGWSWGVALLRFTWMFL